MDESRDKSLFELLHHPRIWRGNEQGEAPTGIATGFAELDASLPWRGWPPAALTEVLLSHYGRGELRLLLPALARLSQADDGRRLVWIAPPWVPYAPALEAAGLDLSRLLVVHADSATEIFWAAEQSLRSGSCAAVLVWARQCQDSGLRRLQLAASEGDTLGIVFRPDTVGQQFSPAVLRLCVAPEAQGLRVDVIKNRGARPVTLQLPLGAAHTRRTLTRLQTKS
ncbi:MAG: translesion DNA synthesis-associated protein ImuA [Gammaproteobacteria bacterium]|nr:translesion DNA synthesis-associated protein ImuA [Gammaproteobacteria bacterium]